jgi:alcohol dehydrogenase class IV
MLRSGSYKAEHEVIDIISVPSAAGTGSEVTQFATIWDVNKTAKFSIDTPQNYPKMSLVIPELTLTLPQKLTFSTGVDALSHAVEAYWAKPTTFVVKDIALKAIDTIMTYLPKVLDDPKNLELRNYQSRGALLAGMAFARTRTTACHSISYAMTMQYGVPHGIACCMTLDPVSKINRDVIVCADDLFNTFEKHGGLQKWLDENAAKAGVSLKLKDWGVDEAGIDHLVTQTFTKGRMDNNPVDISPEKVKEILQGIYA